MKDYIKIIYIIIGLLSVFSLIWVINIIPKQITFIDSCEDFCLLEGLDYETKILSYPWNNINGKCYCKSLILIENFNKGEKE